MKENTIDEQKRLEAESRDLASARFDRRQEMAEKRGDAENSDLGRATINSLIGTLTKAFTTVSDAGASGRAGRKSALTDFLTNCALSYEEIAFITLRAVINRALIFKSNSLTDVSVANAISLRLEDELFLRGLQKTDRGLVKEWQKECVQRSLDRTEARSFMRRQVRNLEMDWSYTDAKGREWDDITKLKIGRFLLEIVATSTNIVYLKTIRLRKTKSKKLVYITPEFEEFLLAAREQLKDRATFYLPMVVPPQPWCLEDGLYGGGYLTKDVRPYPLVKKAKTAWLDDIAENEPEVLLRSINAVQETPWRINKTLLAALDHVYGLDRSLAGLPMASKESLPPAPEEYDKEYRRRCWEVHERNRCNLTTRLFITQVIWLGEKFSEYERFYFPHDLDSRGRAYPKPAFLNPQGPDYVKGLLEFADGKPLATENAAAWLAVHVANCWGEDKLALDDRIAWTDQHEEMLLSVAENPLDDLRWTQADNPFQFLAAAISWAGYLKEGLDYVCHTPIAVDATCSGLQHYSAMLLDSVGGSAVNLLDLPERQDVYADVAKRTITLMEADLGTDKNNLAQAWLDFGVDRKITKRSVMVVPYAATYISCAQYTREAVRERLAQGVAMPWAGEEPEFVHYGAKKIWEAIAQTVVAASDAMRWISQSASAYARNKENTYLKWGTPSGMVVWHRKPSTKPWRMNTVLDGSRVQMQAFQEMITLDHAKMATSTPPSFVHSMDAAHMCLAIDASLEAGLSDFGVVHDSFATHAADMEVFGHCIRDTFHEMYTSQDILEGLRQQIQEGLEDELAPLPPKGDLDLDQVRTSTFFFS